MDSRAWKPHITQRDIDQAKKTLGLLPEPWPRPVLVLVSGLPGTGKSYLARKLAEQVPMAIVATDAVRFSLFRRPKYTWQESRKVYAVCHLLIDELLAAGIPTLFDATNLLSGPREVVYDLAEKNNAKLVIVETTSPPEVVRSRMDRRALKHDELDLSAADWTVYLHMKKSAQPIRRPHFVVDTSRNFEPALQQIVEAIRN